MFLEDDYRSALMYVLNCLINGQFSQNDGYINRSTAHWFCVALDKGITLQQNKLKSNKIKKTKKKPLPPGFFATTKHHVYIFYPKISVYMSVNRCKQTFWKTITIARNAYALQKRHHLFFAPVC